MLFPSSEQGSSLPTSTKQIDSTWTPVSWKAVTIDDPFWTPHIRVNREHTLPSIYRFCQETGRIGALRLDWKPGMEPVPHIFWDSDVAKWLEAASYSLATHPDPALEAQVDEVIRLIVAAQQPDGYLNTYFTVVEPEKRWTNLRDWHELYCAGHLIEAAVAHFQATGKRVLLDARLVGGKLLQHGHALVPDAHGGLTVRDGAGDWEPCICRAPHREGTAASAPRGCSTRSRRG